MNQVDNEQKNFQISTVKDDDYGRKIWKVKETQILSVQQQEEKKIELKFLESRKEDLNLENKIGKKVVISKDAPKQEQSGFYCELCDALMKDSSSYLDHINGKKHNKLKGMNMKVERVTLDKVMAKFQSLKQQQQKKPIESIQEFEKRYDDEQQRKKDDRKIQKKVKIDNKQIQEEIIEQIEPGLEMMGMAFGFGKKK